MLLYHWQGTARNFGDELNLLLWPSLLPGLLDDDPAAIFLGIGSVFDARHDASALKVVAGAGYGGYEPLPAVDARWVIHWVRGPHTARRLGLSAAYGLGDPAMLISSIGYARTNECDEVGFMPHFESAERGAWPVVASAAGMTLIDPRSDPQAIIAAIGRCRVLLSEAMHGVIVADALRVPWIAMRPLAAVHWAKWYDWAGTLDLHIEFVPLAASSLQEWLHASRLAALHSGRCLLHRYGSALDKVPQGWFIEQAAQALRRAAGAAPQLSTEIALERCQMRMLERLQGLQRDPLRAPGRV